MTLFAERRDAARAVQTRCHRLQTRMAATGVGLSRHQHGPGECQCRDCCNACSNPHVFPFICVPPGVEPPPQTALSEHQITMRSTGGLHAADHTRAANPLRTTQCRRDSTLSAPPFDARSNHPARSGAPPSPHTHPQGRRRCWGRAGCPRCCESGVDRSSSGEPKWRLGHQVVDHGGGSVARSWTRAAARLPTRGPGRRLRLSSRGSWLSTRRFLGLDPRLGG